LIGFFASLTRATGPPFSSRCRRVKRWTSGEVIGAAKSAYCSEPKPERGIVEPRLVVAVGQLGEGVVLAQRDRVRARCDAADAAREHAAAKPAAAAAAAAAPPAAGRAAASFENVSIVSISVFFGNPFVCGMLNALRVRSTR
jgi:hypothetical protein